jgi:hypothetical protein
MQTSPPGTLGSSCDQVLSFGEIARFGGAFIRGLLLERLLDPKCVSDRSLETPRTVTDPRCRRDAHLAEIATWTIRAAAR